MRAESEMLIVDPADQHHEQSWIDLQEYHEAIGVRDEPLSQEQLDFLAKFVMSL